MQISSFFYSFFYFFNSMISFLTSSHDLPYTSQHTYSLFSQNAFFYSSLFYFSSSVNTMILGFWLSFSKSLISMHSGQSLKIISYSLSTPALKAQPAGPSLYCNSFKYLLIYLKLIYSTFYQFSSSLIKLRAVSRFKILFYISCFMFLFILEAFKFSFCKCRKLASKARKFQNLLTQACL